MADKEDFDVNFTDFYHNRHAKSVLGLSIDETARFNKDSFINQFKPQNHQLWEFIRDAIESYTVYYIEDPDSIIERSRIRYADNPCNKKTRKGKSKSFIQQPDKVSKTYAFL